MLALALKAIRKAKNRPDDIRIFVDTTTEQRLQEVEHVRDSYFPEAFIFRAKPHIALPSGMWNILNAIKQGASADRLYLIEEDVIVHPHYFDWHDQNSSQSLLATCGRYHRPGYDVYTNPGASFTAGPIFDGLVQHINDDLFRDRMNYYLAKFGQMDHVSDLDDGMIRRYALKHGYKVKYPETPTCAHIGFRAYNHYAPHWVNEGNIEQRIAGLEKMLVRMASEKDRRFTFDFEPVKL